MSFRNRFQVGARPVRALRVVFATMWTLLGAATASSQSAQRAVFVANNGNLEGSVSSFTFGADGVPQFVMKFVIGSRPNSQQYDPGTNAYGISLTPDGRFLAVSHTTSSTTVEQITILSVASDATLDLEAKFTTDDSPLDLQWLSNDTLAVTRTRVSGANQVIAYRFDPEAPALTEIDREDTGAFNTALVLHPVRPLLYAQDSTGFQIRTFNVNGDGTLALAGSTPTGGVYPIGPGITHSGAYVYSGGGISGDGHRVSGFAVDDASGVLVELAGSPFESPGASPKTAAATSDDKYLIVGHGTDATARTFAIDAETGSLTSTGHSFDVGLQGTLGDVAVLDELILITDNSTAIDGKMGLYAFTLAADGQFVANGDIVDSTGVAPTFMAVWAPHPCDPCDVNCDGSVNGIDIQAFVEALNGSPSGCSPCGADANADGSVNAFDIAPFVECLNHP